MKPEEIEKIVDDDFVKDFIYVIDKDNLSLISTKIIIATVLKIFIRKYITLSDGDKREYILKKYKKIALQKEMSFA